MRASSMPERLLKAEQELRWINRALRAINEGHKALIHATHENALLEAVCRGMVEVAGYKLAWVGYAEQDETRSVRPVAQAGFEEGYLEALHVNWADTKRGRGPTGTAMRMGKPVIARDILKDPDFAPWRERAIQHGYASSIALPLVSPPSHTLTGGDKGGTVIGALNLYAGVPDAFDDNEVKLLKDLAGDLAYGIFALRTKAALRESEEIYRQLFNAGPDPVFLLDSEGHFLDANDAALTRYGYTLEALSAMTPRELSMPDFQEKAADRVRQSLEKGGQFEWRHRRKDGAELPVEINTRPITFKGQQCILANVRDITERKQAEDELRKYREYLEEVVKERTEALLKNQKALMNVVEDLNDKSAALSAANERLKELDRLKSVFLASMSHELRTPLNAIIGFTGILLMGMSGELNDEQKKQLGLVKNSGYHLLGLINDVLDISKIEAGRMEAYPEDFLLDEVIQEAMSGVFVSADDKGLALVRDAPEGIVLHSDRRRLTQILLNLLSNAVKFTEKGSVRVSARLIAVTDMGIGIKPEEMNRLFFPFQQVDMSMTKKFEGTGLGLYLSKKLAELLGGDIAVKSEYGKGSVFTVMLPMRIEN